MAFVVETAPTLEAVEERLSAAVATLQRSPLERVNVLVGSNLQRVYFRRRIAADLDYSANVRFLTPVELAGAIRDQASLPPRQPLPEGAEPILLDGILRDLRREGAVRRLDPRVQGVAASVAGSLRDLREAALGTEEYRGLLTSGDDRKLHELAAIYERFLERIRPFRERTGTYLDALDPLVPDEAVARALGDGPLLVAGLYDAPQVQIALIARCARVVETRVLLVAPAEEEFAFAHTFRESLTEAGAEPQHYTSLDPGSLDPGVEAEFGSTAQAHYFSAPTRQAEAEEVARRALRLASDQGIAFNEMAVLHRLDSGADDMIAAAFERAGVPVYRASGRPLRHTAAGRAALVLLDLMLRVPERQRLLELAANPSLRAQLPGGIRPKPLLWERVSKQAGMVKGWQRFLDQLNAYIADRERDPQENAEFVAKTARELQDLVRDLFTRAKRLPDLPTWGAYRDWFLELIDDYLRPVREAGPEEERDPSETLRDRIGALGFLDQAGVEVDAERFRTAAEQAIRRAVINDRRALSKGVFVGNVGAARSLRFDAVFLVECGERIFPPLVRQDPLLLDSERQRLNDRLQRDVLPLKRDRLEEEAMLFQLVRQSARRVITVSWARRTNSTGAPRLPSSYLLQSIPHEVGELARVEEMYAQGLIDKLPTRLAGAAPSASAIAEGDWSRTADALDGSDFRLAILEAAPRIASELLPQLWDGHARWVRAREARAAPRFGEWDGVIRPDQIANPPLEQLTSPTALETYASCPYRYFVRQALHVHAISEPGEALEMSPLDRGTMVHRILEDWVREGKTSGDWASFVKDESRLFAIADREFERAGRGGLSGLPATWSIVQAEVRADLDEVYRIELERVGAGYQPLDVELDFGFEGPPVELTLPSGTTLRLRGRIDRVDQGPEGLVAVDYKTGRLYKRADAYRNGSALQLPVYAQAVANHYGEPLERVSAEYWYATHKGGFERLGLRGAEALQDDLLWDALETITAGIQGGRFPPYPGEAQGNRRRPNCTFCDYYDGCTTDVDLRFAHKARQDHATVRDFLSLQARR
ncbi:MAG: exodeoxyribonuclease V subunit gamma [Chloroflexi bacterium]|nr:exodeoxyribonuclease V subunit gamma [Chloroflexota bacterium]